MSCFSCFVSRSNKDVSSVEVDNGNGGTNVSESEKGKNVRSGNRRTAATSFSFRELALATSGFHQVNLIGEGGFGKVFKGRLSTNELVAVKQSSPDGCQGVQEFVTEVLMLSLLHDSNLVKLFGYCAEGDQRLLVYEYMPMGSLEDHLFDVAPGKEPLSWNSRIKIALGAARGLEYLHCKAHPPVIHRDMKSANILLDNDFNPKLSDFGLAKLGPVGDNTHVSTRVMGTHGYCAPEYAISGRLTIKSDIYSFGVVLLELISGKRAIDPDRQEQNLVSWFRPYFKHRSNYGNMVDPLLQRNYPIRCLHQAIAVTVMCLQEEPKFRPLIGDVVSALEYIASNSQVDGHGVHSPLLQLDPEMHIS